MSSSLSTLFIAFLALTAPTSVAQDGNKIRIGHFANVTHAQAILGRADGSFAATVNQPLQWYVFNAGPAAVEALFAGDLDLAYLGPNPAINAFLRSREVVILCGSASGGAALVLRADSPIFTSHDFSHALIATPQLGNTQDVAARNYFRRHGYRQHGGTPKLLPIPNSNVITLLLRGELDGAWSVEPWVSRFEVEAGAKIFLEERELWSDGIYPTAYLVAHRKFLTEHPELTLQIVRTHIALTRRLQAGGEKLIELLRQELKRETLFEFSADLMRRSLQRLSFTWDPMERQLRLSAQAAHEIGFLPEPRLDGIFELRFLKQALAED